MARAGDDNASAEGHSEALMYEVMGGSLVSVGQLVAEAEMYETKPL